MRIPVVAVAIVGLMLPTAADAQSDGGVETVSVLIPVRESDRALLKRSDRPTRSRWERVEVPVDYSRPDAIQNALRALGPDAIVENRYPLSGPSDEPLFDQQWGLENTGQFPGGTADADIDAGTAWPQSTGTGITIAVIDSGVDATHVELSAQIWVNPAETQNGLDDDGNGFVDDVVGWDLVGKDNDPSPSGTGGEEAHATMVAGVIASAVNGAGITGVAPDSRVMNLRACNAGACLSLDIADAIYYGVNEGADIINLSLGGSATADPPIEEAIEYARVNDVAVIAAAGNDNLNVDNLPGGEIIIPAGLPHPNILSVAASDHNDSKASFSNYGSQSIDVFAPGDFIRTTGTGVLGDYVYVDGTSFSVAHVSGLAALLLAHDQGITYHELIARIEGFTDNPPGLSGFSRFGRVNAGTTLTKRFIDTDASVFVNAIDWLAEEEITEGCNPPDNHRYCPNDHVTRGEIAVFFARAFSLPATGVDHFTDDDGRFYENAANKMAEAGITVGCAPGKYCGERKVTREELAAMLSRVLGLPATPIDHFIDDTGSIFEGAINQIAEASITEGCNPPVNDRFCPADQVTRGQMAAFIKRAVSQLG